MCHAQPLRHAGPAALRSGFRQVDQFLLAPAPSPEKAGIKPWLLCVLCGRHGCLLQDFEWMRSLSSAFTSGLDWNDPQTVSDLMTAQASSGVTSLASRKIPVTLSSTCRPAARSLSRLLRLCITMPATVTRLVVCGRSMPCSYRRLRAADCRKVSRLG